jgi:hypothetical protein
MHLHSGVPTSDVTSFSLVALESMPCGCVASVYRASPTIVELELVEAKGPHCVFWAHQAGRVVRMDVPSEFDED